jgi:uncharacterized membrane protein YphA (DoxX/SURF4 family)
MKKVFGNPVIGTIFRLILAGVLGFAGYIKLIEPNGARDAIMAYRLLPPEIAPFLGYALPAIEVVMAALLLVGLFVRISGLLSAVLMVLFIIGIASVWIRGYSIDCGCFGGGGDISAEGIERKYTIEIIRDIALALMGLWLFRWPHTLVALESNKVGHTFTEDNQDTSDI